MVASGLSLPLLAQSHHLAPELEPGQVLVPWLGTAAALGQGLLGELRARPPSSSWTGAAHGARGGRNAGVWLPRELGREEPLSPWVPPPGQ